ncbi:hypothetical protein TELCIR_02049 [Teladorsagia circumcincta]|uniref:Peptidase M13 N-terminal domain-containing protein n=1 Tax=Teladorsagia circumcincta TaxID=45464 RepID=A0A2G9V054_TELCI|nr:hypothetical protein TELCIR_02049 [Teladorsagia circumcincta]
MKRKGPEELAIGSRGQHNEESLALQKPMHEMYKVKRIAVDIGVNYDKTNAPPDILQMVIFMSKLHSIPVPHLGQLLKDNDFFNESEFRNLSNVDIGITQVNWTQYFLLVAPPEVHHVLLSNPPVALPDEEYLGRLDGLLNETSPRTITNYVMIQYILSWIPLLGDEYRSLLEAPKAEIEGMVLEIIGGLKDEVKENEWMDDEFKKAVLQKLNKITWSLIDDDMFYNDTALDEEYSAHIGLANLPFLDMLESITSIEKVESFRKLSVTLDLRKELAKFSVMGYQINAYYTTLLNRIMIPLPFLEFPLFERKYPRYDCSSFKTGKDPRTKTKAFAL